MSAVQLTETSPADGCTVCGSQATVTLDSIAGRRCAAHPNWCDPLTVHRMGDRAASYVRATLPPGPYDPSLADEMCALGRHDAAFAYLGAFLARETDRRYAAATARVGVGR